MLPSTICSIVKKFKKYKGVKKMKKEKKVLLVFIIAMISCMVISKIVYAMSFKFNVSSNKTEVKPGEEITVSIKISDIDMGENGINAIESTLVYDNQIFETVTKDDMTTQNNWTIEYNQQVGNFLLSNINTAGVKENQTIGFIKFKIRADAKPTTTTIKFNDIKSNDGNTITKDSDKSITIKIIGDGTAVTTNVSKATTVTSSTGDKKATAIVAQKSSSPENMPYTGVEDTLLISIIISSIVAAVFWFKYKKIEIE